MINFEKINYNKQGELDDHENLVSIFRQVDVVISTLAVPQHLHQLKLIHAMKMAGNIKVINTYIYIYSYFYLYCYVKIIFLYEKI